MSDRPAGGPAPLDSDGRAPSVGVDRFGPFWVGSGKCGYCDKPEVVVRYMHKPRIPEYPRSSPSLILLGRSIRWTRQVGVTCGCYAKAHRQVAHIEGPGGRRS